MEVAELKQMTFIRDTVSTFNHILCNTDRSWRQSGPSEEKKKGNCSPGSFFSSLIIQLINPHKYVVMRIKWSVSLRWSCLQRSYFEIKDKWIIRLNKQHSIVINSSQSDLNVLPMIYFRNCFSPVCTYMCLNEKNSHHTVKVWWLYSGGNHFIDHYTRSL